MQSKFGRVTDKTVYNRRAQWKKGTTVFDNLKRSKVNKEFL